MKFRALDMNILQLSIKEFRSLWHDKILLILIIWAFSGGIYVASTASSQELNNAPIAIVDEDGSPLSKTIGNAFNEPYFNKPAYIDFSEVEPALNSGQYTFVVIIPSGFQSDLMAEKQPTLQINIDATQMSQAGIGDVYIQNIIGGEINQFVTGKLDAYELPVKLIVRNKYNPNLTSSWFGSIMEIINNVTMLSIILSGAAVIREREHGTLEHLLVMPVKPLEIVLSKVLANGLVVLVAATLSLVFIVQYVLHVPIKGSVYLFVLGAGLHLFATTSMGIFLGTIARTMPQLGLLFILTVLPLQMLSGGITPYESMPQIIQNIMLIAPTTHFVNLSQAILYRGGGFSIIWSQLLVLVLIGSVFLLSAVSRFRASVANA
ncbi:ABC transporter permease [Neptunomonas antarctica]|uniref:ABC-2 type transport system permease protein n=1 Tax=Neptunomonas antarctica TaxID=619304 RepID=A0A1N7M8X0_9GAMM|nr:ABC transporter permease [Neptunomonas antarctica]SIS82419.1 ABC-2 type transport system permease protein [Neptunomonas antarctica]